MPLLKRAELNELLKTQDQLPQSQIYLFFGERFLCKDAADALVTQMLRTEKGAVHTIDGDNEDPAQTLARLTSFSLLPGKQIFRVTDTRLFHSKVVAEDLWQKAELAYNNGKQNQALRCLRSLLQTIQLEPDKPGFLSESSNSQWQNLFGFSKPSGNLAWAENLLLGAPSAKNSSAANMTDRYVQALEKGLPTPSLLLLTAETVDKRQKLFTYIKKHGVAVDCTVATGASSSAQQEQKDVLREIMTATLGSFGKSIDPKGAELLFERVGFHPVAVAMESEKLAHYVGENRQITLDDIEMMVGRSREDALFELTDAFSKRQTGKTLAILNRMLEQGMHGLAILAAMRNFLRKQLIFRTIQMQPTPAWRTGMNAREFQNHYLPALKDIPEYSQHLQGHPYALFMSFTKAGEYSTSGLKRWLAMLLEAEYLLKGSPLPQKLVLEELFLALLKGRPKVLA